MATKIVCDKCGAEKFGKGNDFSHLACYEYGDWERYDSLYVKATIHNHRAAREADICVKCVEELMKVAVVDWVKKFKGR